MNRVSRQREERVAMMVTTAELARVETKRDRFKRCHANCHYRQLTDNDVCRSGALNFLLCVLPPVRLMPLAEARMNASIGYHYCDGQTCLVTPVTSGIVLCFWTGASY